MIGDLWLRPILAHPLRLAATVAGTAIGVAAFVSTILASSAAVSFLARDVEDIAGTAKLEIRRSGGVELAEFARLRRICAEAVLTPVVEDVALLPAISDLVRVLGIDLLEAAGDRAPWVSEPNGEARDALLHGNGVALSRALASELGVDIGDSFVAQVRSRPHELTVAALLDPPRLGSAWSRLLLCDIALAQELTGRLDVVDRIELRRREGDSLTLEQLASSLRTLLPLGYRIGAPSERRDEGERMVSALSFNLTALSGVSILVGTVLVATALATSVVQRRSTLALLRSLGASNRQLRAAILIEAGLIGTLGGALGVGLGWIGALASVGAVRATTATVVEGSVLGQVRLEPSNALLGLAIGIASALAAAVLPMREALRTPPIQALRRGSEHRPLGRGRLWTAIALVAGAVFFTALPPLDDRPVFALVAALLLLALILVLAEPIVAAVSGLRPGRSTSSAFTSLRVAQAALAAGRTRAAWAAGAVGVAVALAVAMTTMVGSFRQTVVDWTEQSMRSDLFVRPLIADTGVSGGGLAPEVERIARDLFGDAAVDAFHTTTAWVDELPVSFHGAGFAVVARAGGVPFLDGRPSAQVFAEAIERRGAIVNEPFARRFDVATGDAITIDTSRGPTTREVIGVYRDYSGHTGRVVLDLPDYLSLEPDLGPQSIAIFLPEGVEPAEARRELAGRLGDRFALDLLLNREVRAEVLEIFERTFAVTIALQLLASIVAVLAVMTVLGALVQERRRELAILRVLGASRRQNLFVVLAEAGLLGATGAISGILIGLAVGWVLVAVVNVQSFGWTLRFLVPWRAIGFTIAAVVPAAVLAGLVPALWSARTKPREALRETG